MCQTHRCEKQMHWTRTDRASVLVEVIDLTGAFSPKKRKKKKEDAKTFTTRIKKH